VNWEYIHSKLDFALRSNGISDIANPLPNTSVVNVGNTIELPLRKIYPEK